MATVNDSYPGTRLRAFRISDELYAAARDKAKGQGDTLSEIVRAALEAYLSADHVSDCVSRPSMERHS